VVERNRIRALLGQRVRREGEREEGSEECIASGTSHTHTFLLPSLPQPLDLSKTTSAAEVAVQNMKEKKAQEAKERELAELEVGREGGREGERKGACLVTRVK